MQTILDTMCETYVFAIGIGIVLLVMFMFLKFPPPKTAGAVLPVMASNPVYTAAEHQTRLIDIKDHGNDDENVDVTGPEHTLFSRTNSESSEC